MKVIAITLLAALSAEIALRLNENNLSLNLRHISEIPALARQLHYGARPRILFLGNSYTRRDTDLQSMAESLKTHGISNLNAVKAVPDATSIIDWHYTFQTFFEHTKNVPDIVVIGFTINRHLSDKSPIDVRLLSRRFCRIQYVTEVFRHDITDADKRILFLLSRASSVVGNQYHVRQRLLDKIIPNYRFGAQEINRLSRIQTTAEQNNNHTFTRLERFMALMRKHGIITVFVAMPAPRQEYFHPKLESTIIESGGIFIDCRSVPGINSGSFIDGCYLNKSSAKTYSSYLAEQLVDIIKKIQ
ncbi:MAG: hypothetical protein JXN60_09480 [Lentisphaerae bacterium]|nr:hypothetical protein [Lentisphaerota bacterium]